ncbi:MAG: prepilin-type N-terminal cleavage/methylation domain-containing protein [Gammaproteobacteria bacterium]|nr:prepilin-type N-terminal cleavage/methylation domain-containing protein [Gammaproteobacteria bacterium]
MKSYGFTLIELVLALTVISILGLISYPSYNEHLLRTRRVYMTMALLDLASSLEIYYASNHTYDGATLEDLLSNRTQSKNHYCLELTTKDDLYTLKATPIGNQKKDLICQTLSLDQDGNKSASGNADIAKCWL